MEDKMLLLGGSDKECPMFSGFPPSSVLYMFLQLFESMIHHLMFVEACYQISCNWLWMTAKGKFLLSLCFQLLAFRK